MGGDEKLLTFLSAEEKIALEAERRGHDRALEGPNLWQGLRWEVPGKMGIRKVSSTWTRNSLDVNDTGQPDLDWLVNVLRKKLFC